MVAGKLMNYIVSQLSKCLKTRETLGGGGGLFCIEYSQSYPPE